MSFLIQQKSRHEALCEQRTREEDLPRARFHALKAADFAFALARRTDGTVALRWTEEAEEWLGIAERMSAESAQRGGGDRDGAKNKQRAVREDSDDSVSPDAWLITEKPSTTFGDIAGMTEAKNAIHEMIVFPLQDPESMKALNLQAGGGILLYGPPGTGKTTLARAAAHEVDAAFFYASGAQIRSKWHGESEQRLRALIQAARSEPVSILFLDDVDGLLPRRGGNSVVDNRIVTEFLQNVGGFDQEGGVMMLLGATNKPWEIDEAVFRTKRFDDKLYVGPPDVEARLGILVRHLDGVPLEEAFDVEQWADRLDGYSGSDVEGVVNAAKRAALGRKIRQGDELLVQISDFEQALNRTPCSITPQMLKQYARFREQRFGS